MTDTTSSMPTSVRPLHVLAPLLLSFTSFGALAESVNEVTLTPQSNQTFDVQSIKLDDDDNKPWYMADEQNSVIAVVGKQDKGFNTTASVTQVSAEDNRTGLQLNLGFDVTENVAIEAKYVDLDELNTDPSAPGKSSLLVSNPENFFNQSHKLLPSAVEGFSVGSSYRYNVTDNVGLTGSVGLFNWDGEVNPLLNNPVQGAEDNGDKGTDLYWSVGSGFNLGSDVTLSIEYERYQRNTENQDMWSIGLNYHFK